MLMAFSALMSGCFREKAHPSGKYAHNDLLPYEQKITSVYSTGSVQQVEKELTSFLSTLDRFQARDPHVFAYNWQRGLTQGRLALLYRQLGYESKAERFMSLSVESIRRFKTGYSNDPAYVEQITWGWVTNVIEKIETHMDPAWKDTQHQPAR